MQALRLLLPRRFRAFGLARARVFAALADAPILFFAVVLGVAVIFRVAVGSARTAEPDPALTSAVPSAPTAQSTTPTTSTSAVTTSFRADPAAQPLAAAAPAPPATTMPGQAGPRTHGRRGPRPPRAPR